LDRAGRRVAKRRRAQGRVGASHRVHKDESVKWFQQKVGSLATYGLPQRIGDGFSTTVSSCPRSRKRPAREEEVAAAERRGDERSRSVMAPEARPSGDEKRR
jgi:hypothetical protein